MLSKLYFFFCNFRKYGSLFVDTFFFSQLYENNEDTFLTKKIQLGKKIIIYGFGPYGEELFIKFFSSNIISGIYDANYLEMEKYVLSPNAIQTNGIDYYVITVMNLTARAQIRRFLIEKGVTEEKIVELNYRY